MELLSEYANAWPSGWRFLTGAPTTLSRVWSDYGIFVNRVIDTATGRDGQDKYEVIHNGRAIVIDAEGKIAGEVRSRWTSPELQQALEAVLAGGLPANAGRADLNPIQAFLDRCGEFASENPQAFLGIVLLVMLPGLVLPFFLLRWIFASGNPTDG